MLVCCIGKVFVLPSVLRSCVRVHVSAEACFCARTTELERLSVIIMMVWYYCYFGWCDGPLAHNLLGALVAVRLEPAVEGISDTNIDGIVRTKPLRSVP